MKALVAVVGLALCGGVAQARTKSHAVVRFVTLIQTSAPATPSKAPAAETWSAASGEVKPYKGQSRSDDPFRTPLFRNAIPLR